MRKELSVVVPAYNEEKAILETLLEIARWLADRSYRYEILAVNDGSTDSTRKKILEAAQSYPQIRLIDMPKNSGKGEAVKEGVRHASLPYCLFIDADNSTRIGEWAKFEKAFEDGAKVVIASRRVRGAEIVYPQPFMRRALGTGYRVICRSLFGLSIRDINCGFKAYETPIAKRIYSRVKMNDWTFDLEVFCLLKEEGIPVSEIPVRWEHKDKKSSLKPVGTAIRSLKSVAAIKKNLRVRR